MQSDSRPVLEDVFKSVSALKGSSRVQPKSVVDEAPNVEEGIGPFALFLASGALVAVVLSFIRRWRKGRYRSGSTRKLV